MRTLWVVLVTVLLAVAWGVAEPFIALPDAVRMACATAASLLTLALLVAMHATQRRTSTALHRRLDRLQRTVAARQADRAILEQFSEAEIARLVQLRRAVAHPSSDQASRAS